MLHGPTDSTPCRLDLEAQAPGIDNQCHESRGDLTDDADLPPPGSACRALLRTAGPVVRMATGGQWARRRLGNRREKKQANRGGGKREPITIDVRQYIFFPS